MAIPYRSRAPLEIIRFAAANHLCVDLTYDVSGSPNVFFVGRSERASSSPFVFF
jgi:hypothetical protein